MLSTSEFDEQAKKRKNALEDEFDANDARVALWAKVNSFHDVVSRESDQSRDDYGPKAHRCWHVVFFIAWSCFAGFGAFYATAYLDEINWDYLAYACILEVMIIIAIGLDFLDDNTYGWKSFQIHFERTFFGASALKLFGGLFFILATISWTAISLEAEGLWSGLAADFTIYITYYIAGICMLLTFLSSWELFSFYSATNPNIQGLMWISIIGGLVLLTARKLRPPPSREDRHKLTWHKQPNNDDMIEGVLWALNMLFLLFVFFGCLGLTIFADLSLWCSNQPLYVALIVFTIISFAIMLNPIAPGSVVDVAGGFLFLTVFANPDGVNWGFFESWALGLAVITLFHYLGACIQWWLGTLPSIQIWLNTYIPVEVLAATDAVLGDADYIKVGLVGYVFLDTLNGLNQGRINMDFWTQLLSEWACIPSAISLSALGASLAAKQESLGLDVPWTATAVPLLIITSGLVAAAGSLFGLKELTQSTDGFEYWSSQEKWQAVHYFFKKLGYSATEKGYREDIYQLVSGGITKDGDPHDCLLAKIYVLHLDYVARRSAAPSEVERLKIIETHNNKLRKARNKHFESIRNSVPELDEKNLMVKVNEGEEADHDFWYDAKDHLWKRKLQVFVTVTLILAYWGTVFGFYMSVSMEDAVSKGTKALPHLTNGYGELYYFSLVWFCVVFPVYYYKYTWESITSVCTSSMWILQGMPTHAGQETKYHSPAWTVPADLERSVLTKLREEFGQDYKLVDPIVHEENRDLTPKTQSANVELTDKKTYTGEYSDHLPSGETELTSPNKKQRISV